MKILEIIPTLASGGAERFVVDLCNELSKQHNVVLITLYNLNRHNFFVKEVSSRVKIISLDKKKGVDISLFSKIKRVISQEEPDVVHTHLRALIYCIAAFSMNTTIRYYHTIHNDAKMEAGDFISKMIRYWAFKHKLVHPITISDESQLSFTKFYGLESSLIYNGCAAFPGISTTDEGRIARELDNLKVNSDSKLIVNVARIQKQKNQLILCKAIDHLNLLGYHFDLAIIGATNDREIYNNILSLKSPYVHVLGTRTNPRDYLLLSDAFCLSSTYEGMPISLIECFSVGTIPICTPVGGIKNMIKDNYNGILSSGISQDAIEEALISFYNSSNESLKTMSKNSLSSFQIYNMSSCARKYVELMYRD